MEILKIIGFALLLIGIECIPTKTTIEESWLIDWEMESQFCGKDFLNLLSIVCNNMYFDGTVETYLRRRNEIVKQSLNCCIHSCKIKQMLNVCVDKSIPIDPVMVHGTNIKKAVPHLPIFTRYPVILDNTNESYEDPHFKFRNELRSYPSIRSLFGLLKALEFIDPKAIL